MYITLHQLPAGCWLSNPKDRQCDFAAFQACAVALLLQQQVGQSSVYQTGTSFGPHFTDLVLFTWSMAVMPSATSFTLTMWRPFW
jgi:hypothetical protein